MGWWNFVISMWPILWIPLYMTVALIWFVSWDLKINRKGKK